MKLLPIIFLFLLILSCKNPLAGGHLAYIQTEAFKIKELTKFEGNYKPAGSYKLRKDTVISKFDIESKYELMIIKLKNVSPNYKLNYHSNKACSTFGNFSSVNTSLYDVNFSTPIFKNDNKINTIDLISDKKISYQINNDTIKSFGLSFHKFAVKINNLDNKLFYSEVENYDLESLSANFLFYKIEDVIYLFILTPLNGKVILNDNKLYDLLFPTKDKEL